MADAEKQVASGGRGSKELDKKTIGLKAAVETDMADVEHGHGLMAQEWLKTVDAFWGKS